MSAREPSWWYGAGADGWVPRVLAPAGAIFGALTARRMQQAPTYRAKIPVIAVGNFTAGGTGKTPFVRVVAEALRGLGHKPVVLTRGYGGCTVGPHWVDEHDTALNVGDEPLMLSNNIAVMVARDRVAGAQVIDQGGASTPDATVIVMDDGLQNPSLAKDLTFAVVDAARGFGNCRCIPAGPLRAPLIVQAPRVDALVLNRGDGRTPLAPSVEAMLRNFSRPMMSGVVVPGGDLAWLKGARVIAYAGIGVPERFFATVEAAGGLICRHVAFGDHHWFTDGDAVRLLELARQENALLVTTEKDILRLHRSTGELAKLDAATKVLPIRLALDDAGIVALQSLLASRVPPPAGSQRHNAHD